MDASGHDDDMYAERDRYVRNLVESPATLKVVVAGPGAGKTHAFRELLKEKEGDRLALTFIVNLMKGLRVDLGGLAEVQTLHGFAKNQLYKHAAHGVSRRCDYYWAMKHVLARDATVVLGHTINTYSVEGVLHQMEEGELLDVVLASGVYYDAAGYTDSVYRVVRHLQAHPGNVPLYEQIVVDEFQDFSPLEVALIDVLAAVSPTLIAGDDDQALYTFKHAKADYLRDKAADEAWTTFELPFCTRCTQVLVEGVGRIVHRAHGAGLLLDRVDKRYECFSPEKRDDSARYPKIVHADCTNESHKVHYVTDYIGRLVTAITDEDVRSSSDGGYPTVLIIANKPFNGLVAGHLAEAGVPNVTLLTSSDQDMELLDAYRFLSKRPRSRLGWRIAVALDDPGRRDAIVRLALAGEELADLVPDDYRREHVEVAGLVARVRADEALTDEEVGRVESKLEMSLAEIRLRLGVEDGEDPEPEAVEGAPTITIATRMGAKGLQAEHVFVVGMNPPFFPADNASPEEQEVCEMLVALTRARKSCHLVSIKMFNGQYRPPSIFIDWLGDLVEHVTVDRNYFQNT